MKKLLCVLFSLMLCANLISCTPTEGTPAEEPIINDPYAINFTEDELRLISEFGSPTEEEPKSMIRSFTPEPVVASGGIYPLISPKTFATNYYNIVKVRYTGKKINPKSFEKRAEYQFEVIDWIKGGGGNKKKLSLYSPVFDGWNLEPLEQSLAYFLEYSQYECRYTVGEEYIVAFHGGDEFVYSWVEGIYIPLNNPSASRMNYKSISNWDEYEEEKIGEMNAEEFEAFLRGIIEKYNTPEEGSSDSNEENGGETGEESAGLE